MDREKKAVVALSFFAGIVAGAAAFLFLTGQEPVASVSVPYNAACSGPVYPMCYAG